KRGVADYGRMVGAARRVGAEAKAQPDAAPVKYATGVPTAPLLAIHTPELTLEMGRGDSVALTGPSGSGKSSLLMQIAGLAGSDGIALQGVKPTDWLESALRESVTAVPQRSALIAGSIRDNLRLAADADDGEMWRVLETVALSEAVSERGGLDAKLGEGGAGLSGGQAQRLTLARAILKRPKLLLLDEPTEGLDADTADHVLTAIRAYLPETAILATLHRSARHPVFDRQVSLSL
ncbi:MAG TPA: ATP-binding cassette domain-containing protein, partial [Halomonas sp.]|nr:ATP-binding cassette domain-containing protein [Halomonas sp.]